MRKRGVLSSFILILFFSTSTYGTNPITDEFSTEQDQKPWDYFQSTWFILQELDERAMRNFSRYTTREEMRMCFEQAKSYRDKSNSLQGIIKAKMAFQKAASLSEQHKDLEIFQKAGYNYAMVCLALGDIPQALAFLKTCASLPFQPAKKALGILQKELKFPDVILPPERLGSQAPQYPFGYLRNEYSEIIYEKIKDKGVQKIEWTSEDTEPFKLYSKHLEDLRAISYSIEEYVNNYENSCVILLGRSCLFQGMALKYRKKLNADIIHLPLSGAIPENITEESYNAYQNFARQKIPSSYQNYFILDVVHTNRTIKFIAPVLQEFLNGKTFHVLAITATEEISLELPQDFASCKRLPLCPDILYITVVKMLFERLHLLPGKPFYPPEWSDSNKRSSLLEYDPLEDTTKLVVNVRRDQIRDFFGDAL